MATLVSMRYPSRQGIFISEFHKNKKPLRETQFCNQYLGVHRRLVLGSPQLSKSVGARVRRIKWYSICRLPVCTLLQYIKPSHNTYYKVNSTQIVLILYCLGNNKNKNICKCSGQMYFFFSIFDLCLAGSLK